MALRYVINQMKEPSYLFVDGAYLEHVIAYHQKRLGIGSPEDIRIWPALSGFDKVFYYDCLPARKDKESIDAHNARCASIEAKFNELRKIPGFHVFQGRAVGIGARSRQKGVDVQLAVHMLTFLHRGIVRNCTLLAGDSDFIPLVEALVLDGATVTVRSHRTSQSMALIHAADRFQPITLFGDVFECLSQNCRKEVSRPEHVFYNDDNIYNSGVIIKRGSYQGEMAVMWEKDGFFHITHGKINDPGNWEHTRSNNMIALEIYAEDRGAFIEWT